MSGVSTQDVGTKVSAPIDHEWRADAVDEHLVSFLDPTSNEADQYRALRHAIERHCQAKAKKVIAITSAVAGDGKTTTTLNLAGSLARASDVRILVVDLDLRTRTLGNSLGLISQSPGVVDLILDPDLTLDDVIRRHLRFQLSVLPAGPALTVPYEMLKSPRMAEVLQTVRQQYDYILLDTPPLVVPDFRLITDLVDGVVIVVAAHRTPRKLLEDALNQMDPTKLMGIVFNSHDEHLSGYYGYYSGYYGSYLNGGRRREPWGNRLLPSVLAKMRRLVLG